MVKLSRYFLVVVAIVAFAIVIPKLYWMAFAKPISVPFVMYSCIDDDFMIQRSDNGVTRMDRKGNSFTREEYEQKLPMMYTRQLLISGSMYDTIKGIEMDMHDISMNRSTYRSRPKYLIAPDPGLYPLFEAESGRANLEMPSDYFRITWRMEFVDAQSNKVDEEKSQMFSAVLFKRGFKFPATSINGLPTTRKSCDEGYLVVDSSDQLFHVKMIKGKPNVIKVDLPEGLKFKNIDCVDFKNKKYYAYLFSQENELYILTQDEYHLVKLPVDDVNPVEQDVRIYGDMFNYNIITSDEGYMRSQVLDIDYNKVDEYKETWPVRNERTEGKIFKMLFPAKISLSDGKSSYNDFYFEITNSINWLLLSLVLVAAQFVVIRQRKEPVKNHLIDLCIIMVTGVFGFLAVNIFQNKFFA